MSSLRWRKPDLCGSVYLLSSPSHPHSPRVAEEENKDLCELSFLYIHPSSFSVDLNPSLWKKSQVVIGRILFNFIFILISWRLITLQYCSGFCHILTWISLGYTCVPHPDPPARLPLHPIPLGLPSAPGQSNCLMHPTWAGDLFHPR